MKGIYSYGIAIIYLSFNRDAQGYSKINLSECVSSVLLCLICSQGMHRFLRLD